MEEWKSKAADLDAGIQNKYHKALKQIEIMHKDNSQLKGESNSYRTDCMNLKHKYEALERSKNQELE